MNTHYLTIKRSVVHGQLEQNDQLLYVGTAHELGLFTAEHGADTPIYINKRTWGVFSQHTLDGYGKGVCERHEGLPPQ